MRVALVVSLSWFLAVPIVEAFHATTRPPKGCHHCRRRVLRRILENPAADLPSEDSWLSRLGDEEEDVLLSWKLSRQPKNPPREELSDYFLQDPNDAHANAWLTQLSPADKTLVQTLLKDMHVAKKQRDYETSEERAAHLRRHYGVRVYHGNPSFWTRGVAPASYVRLQKDKAQQHGKDMYGPHGHSYRPLELDRGPTDLSPLTTPQIDRLLAGKTKASSEGRYATADAIRFELLINGVDIHHETQQWRRSKGPHSSEWHDSSNNTNVHEDGGMTILEYQRSPLLDNSLPMPEPTRVRVEQLLSDRANALVQGDASLVHFLSLELRKTYRVVVDDQQREWFVSDHDPDEKGDTAFDEPSMPLTPSVPDRDTHPSSEDLVPPLLFAGGESSQEDPTLQYRPSRHSRAVPGENVLQRMEQLIQTRVHKRQQGKFREADAIRTELWETYHVGINDRLRQWSVGGVFDES